MPRDPSYPYLFGDYNVADLPKVGDWIKVLDSDLTGVYEVSEVEVPDRIRGLHRGFIAFYIGDGEKRRTWGCDPAQAVVVKKAEPKEPEIICDKKAEVEIICDKPTCIVCGKGFEAKRKDARCCSPACRKRASRKGGLEDAA